MDLINLVNATFSKKIVSGTDDPPVEPFVTTAKVMEPKITSVNWYSANMAGKHLTAIVYVNTDFFKLADFDRISYSIDGHTFTYNIFTKTRETRFTTRIEVGE